MASPTVLSEEDWAGFVYRFERDRIPFLGSLVAHVTTRMDLSGLATLTSDGICGCISLYVAPRAETVVSCVGGIPEAAHLNAVLAGVGARNVEVLVTPSVVHGGPVIFPFITRCFDAAVVAVQAPFSSATGQTINEVARALKPTGRLGLIVWSHARPSSAELPGSTNILRRPPSPNPDGYSRLLSAFVDATVSAGFVRSAVEEVTCRCEAPNGAAYMGFLRSRVTRRPKMAKSRADEHFGHIEGRIAMEGWAALLVADAPTAA